MKTFNQFEESKDKGAFIVGLITEFKGSKEYKTSLTARKYYRGENTEILSRIPTYIGSDGVTREDIYKANNQIPSNFLNKIVKQQTSYLLANGVTLDDTIKKKLDKKIDLKLQDLGTNAQLDGISWGYFYLENNRINIAVWKGNEFIPLYEESTGQLKAGVRFWQLDEESPIKVELYEENGKTDLQIIKDKIIVTKEKTSYKIKRKVDVLENTIIENSNWSKLPIYPLIFNDTKQSILNASLKNQIDLYDIIQSDFGNNLEDSQDVYWVLKNYMGQDLGEFLADYKERKVIAVDEDGDAKAETIEVPYQAREVALKLLKESIYDTSMSLDTSTLTGSSLTTTAIKTAFINLDLKTDTFERYCLDFVLTLLEFVGEQFEELENYDINFIRRTLVNDTEVIDNLIKSVSGGIMSTETAIEQHPYVENAEEELNRLNNENLGAYKLEEGQGV